MKHIQLPENQHRSFSTTIFLLEKLSHEIEDVLTETHDNKMVALNKDVDYNNKREILNAVSELKIALLNLSEKYGLTKQTLSQAQIVNSRKSKMWEILNNSTSRSMRGFGIFPENLVEEFDNDIENLLQIIKKM